MKQQLTRHTHDVISTYVVLFSEQFPCNLLHDDGYRENKEVKVWASITRDAIFHYFHSETSRTKIQKREYRDGQHTLKAKKDSMVTG